MGKVLFDEFIKNNKGARKVVIAKDKSVVTSLVKIYNDKIESEGAILDWEAKSIKDLAKEIIIFDKSEKGDVSGVIEITSAEAEVIIMQLLMADDKEKYSLIPKESLCMDTMQELYREMNQVRTACYTEEYKKVLLTFEEFMATPDKKKKDFKFSGDEKKICGLLLIINDYLKAINEKNKYDSVKLLQDAFYILSAKETAEEDLLFTGTVGKAFGLLEDNYTYLEREFVKLYCKKNSDNTPVDLNPVEIIPEISKKDAVSKSFYEVYGTENEITTVINEIKNKEYNLGDVNIIYTNPQYEAGLIARLENAKIPYRFASARSLSGGLPYRYLESVIEWALNGFYYSDFKKIIENPIIDDRRYFTVGSNNPYSFGQIAGIGHGLDKYKTFIDSMKIENKVSAEYLDYLKKVDELKAAEKFEELEELKKSRKEKGIEIGGYLGDLVKSGQLVGPIIDKVARDEKQRYAKYVSFLQSFVDIFDVNPGVPVNVRRLYLDIMNVIKKYVIGMNKKKMTPLQKKNRAEYFVVRNDEGFYSFVENKTTIIEALEVIYEHMQVLATSDEVSQDAVTLTHFTGWTVLNRKVQFVIGMSFDSFEAKVTESAILSDKDKERYFSFDIDDAGEYEAGKIEMTEKTEKTGHIELAKLRAIEKQNNFLRTVNTMAGGYLYVMAPVFDTLEKRETAKAIIFDRLSEGFEITKIDKYENVFSESVSIDRDSLLCEIEDSYPQIKEEKEALKKASCEDEKADDSKEVLSEDDLDAEDFEADKADKEDGLDKAIDVYKMFGSSELPDEAADDEDDEAGDADSDNQESDNEDTDGVVSGKSKNNKNDKNKVFEEYLFNMDINIWEDEAEDADVSLNVAFSPTSLRNFIECPFKFIYQKQYFAAKVPEKKAFEWLEASHRGTLMHGVLETYCNENLKGKKGLEVPEFDESHKAILNNLINGWKEIFEKVIPSESDAIIKHEMDSIREDLQSYVEELHKELREGKYMVSSCEHKFSDIVICKLYGEFSDGRKYVIKLHLNGVVDRVDEILSDEPSDVKHYRVIDYKTGKKKNTEDKVKGGSGKRPSSMQHVIYSSVIEKNGGKVDLFSYVFTAEKEDKILSYSGDDIKELPEVTKEYIKDVITELYGEKTSKENSGDISVTVSSGACDYCEFADICVRNLRG